MDGWDDDDMLDSNEGNDSDSDEVESDSEEESDSDEDDNSNKAATLKAIVNANETFSNNLLKSIKVSCKKSQIKIRRNPSEKSDGNIVISPMSLSTMLSLLKAGATGQSDKELATTLSLKLDSTGINQGYKQLLFSFKEHSIVQFANRIYVDNRFKLKEEFVDSAKDNFFSGVEKLNFSNSGDAAAKINKWVSASTNGKIQNVVSADQFNKHTSVVLVNALYFKGKWYDKFDKRKTKDEPFHKSKTETKSVKMMHMKTKHLSYTVDKKLEASVLKLSYRPGNVSEGHYSMLIFLPNSNSSVDHLVKGLGAIQVSTIMKNMKRTLVTLSMPKFKMEMTHQLVPLLKNLGLHSVFDKKAAELGNIGRGDNNEDMFVEEIIQKVYIVVDEEGTEAAAVTAAATGRRTSPSSIEFKVDRPFVFQIVNQDTNLVLFSGVCSDPTFEK